MDQIVDITSYNKEGIISLLRKFKIRRGKITRAQKRKRNRFAALLYKGNKCKICLYDKCIPALEFHHIDPSSKKFTISSGIDKGWRKIKSELDKCILVCPNCHKEIHYNCMDKNKLQKY